MAEDAVTRADLDLSMPEQAHVRERQKCNPRGLPNGLTLKEQSRRAPDNSNSIVILSERPAFPTREGRT